LAVGIAAGILEKAGGPDASDAHMHNLAAAAFGQACAEIDRVLQMMGGTRAFAYGLPGAADFFVTVQGGRSMRLGRLLGAGHTFAEARDVLAGLTLEAAMIVQVMGEALPRLTARGIVSPDELPLLRALIEVVVRDRPAELPLDAFFGGPAPSLRHQPGD
jgi:glycerol-3-phosphate dehydrogenase (NAD(P)+)